MIICCLKLACASQGSVNVYSVFSSCRTVLRVQMTIYPAFKWREGSHGTSMQWHIWVEDSENEHVYHAETWTLTKKMMQESEHRLAFTIPIFEPLPSQYYIRCKIKRLIFS